MQQFRIASRCSICHRRLSGTTIRAHTYYRCPHGPGLPRHYAAYPDHRTVAVREMHPAAPTRADGQGQSKPDPPRWTSRHDSR